MSTNPLDLNNLHLDWGISALANLRTGQPATNYIGARNNFIKAKENALLFQFDGGQVFPGGDEVSLIHDGGGDNNPTIGYGFNLSAQPFAKIEAFLTHAFGGSLTSEQQAGLQFLQDWKNGLFTNRQIIDIAQGRQGTAQQIQALQSLQLNDTQATILLNDELDGFGGFAGRDAVTLSNKLGSGNLDQSLERIAVLSLDFQGLLGPGLKGALQSTDQTNRAEAWFQIRYGHGDFDVPGLQARHAQEAQLFGQISNNPSDAERLLEAKISLSFLFNGTSTLGGVSVNVYTTIKGRDGLDNFESAIATEMGVLQNAFTNGNPVDFVQTDKPGRNSIINAHPDPFSIGQKRDLIFGEDGNDTISGGEGNDYLFGGTGQDQLRGVTGNDFLFGEAGEDFLDGGAGADELDGGAGNDVLVGGQGNDVLYGGDGFDTYIYNINDGQDTISDSDGKGAILYDNHLVQGGLRPAGSTGAYTSTDGTFTFVQSGTDLIINNLITVKDFANGQEGIRLENAPDIATNFDNGRQTRTEFLRVDHYDLDAQGNPTIPVYAPLFDDNSNNSDQAVPPLGDDNNVIHALGGDDYVQSGAGNDQLFGDAGHDTLFAGAGDDRVFGKRVYVCKLAMVASCR